MHGQLSRQLVQLRLVVQAQLGGDERGEPSVDGPGTEVENDRGVPPAVDDRRGGGDWTEAELLDDRPVGGHVAHDDVHAPEPWPERHVRALHVEPAGGLGRARQLAALGIEPATQTERDLILRQRMVAKIVCPCFGHGVSHDSPAAATAVEEREEAAHQPVAVPHDRERLRRLRPPALEDRSRLRAFVAASHALMAAPSSGPALRRAAASRSGRTPREPPGCRSGRACPRCSARIGGPGVAYLVAQLPPGCAPQVPVAHRVRAAEEARHGLAHRLVHHEPVRPASTKGRSSSRRTASDPSGSSSIAASRGSVARRTTEAASSAWRRSDSRCPRGRASRARRSRGSSPRPRAPAAGARRRPRRPA